MTQDTATPELQPKTTQPTTTILDVNDIKAIAQGACFFASGGGGSLDLVLNNIIPDCFDSDATVNLVSLDSLKSENDWGAVISGMGSPLELFNDPQLVKAAIPAYEKLVDLCFALKASGQDKRYESLASMKYCVPIEVGAVNSVVPMIVAANSKLSDLFIIDADGAGRSVPTLSLTTYSGGTLNLYPNILGGQNKLKSSKHFDYGTLNVEDESTLEAALLGMINSQAFGVASGLAIYAASGQSFKQSCPIAGGITHAKSIGEFINTLEGESRKTAILNYINDVMKRQASQVFYGSVSDMDQSTEGLDVGYITITGCGNFSKQEFKIFIKNENIWAQLTDTKGNTKPWVIGPDSINILTDSGDLLDNSDLWKLYSSGIKEQIKVRIIAVEVDPIILDRSDLMLAWTEEVHNNNGPDTYTQPWMNAN